MPAALPIREDLSAFELRALARRESEGRVAARLFAIAHALDGVSRAEAARPAGMDRHAMRWCATTPRVWPVSMIARRPAGMAERG